MWLGYQWKLSASHQIKITVHMDTCGSIVHEVWCCETSPVSFQMAKLSRLKVLKWQLCNHLTYIGICATCDPPLLAYNHFIGKHSSPNKKHSREISKNPTNQPTNQQFNYPLEFRTDDRWHLVQSQCFSIFAHHFDRSCTRLVTQQGALPKILPWWQWVQKQETAVPKVKT